MNIQAQLLAGHKIRKNWWGNKCYYDYDSVSVSEGVYNENETYIGTLDSIQSSPNWELYVSTPDMKLSEQVLRLETERDEALNELRKLKRKIPDTFDWRTAQHNICVLRKKVCRTDWNNNSYWCWSVEHRSVVNQNDCIITIRDRNKNATNWRLWVSPAMGFLEADKVMVAGDEVTNDETYGTYRIHDGAYQIKSNYTTWCDIQLTPKQVASREWRKV